MIGFQILNCAITRDEGRIAPLYNRSRLPLSTPVLGGGYICPNADRVLEPERKIE